MTKLHQWLGALMNALGLPGLVRPTEYRSTRFGTHVRVVRGLLFTVISIDGKEAYFRRLTGTIDGVGFNPRYTPVPVPESASRNEPPADRRS